MGFVFNLDWIRYRCSYSLFRMVTGYITVLPLLYLVSRFGLFNIKPEGLSAFTALVVTYLTISKNPKTENYKKVYKQGFYGRNDFPMTPAGLKEALTNRIDIIDTYLKEVLIPPGIPAIKQVGMFQNFRPLVELEYRDNELYKSPPKKVWDDYLGDKEIRKQQKIEMKYHAKTNINKKPKATKKKKRK